MLPKLRKAMSEIESLLTDRKIHIEEKEEKNRVMIRTDKYMKEPGLAYDNIVFDLIFDHENKFLFIGLLRLPLEVRKKKISKIIVNKLKDYANDNHYTIFLDACGDTNVYWGKQGFERVFIDKNFFEIMGYGENKKSLIKKWDSFKTTKVYANYLSYHD